MTGNGNGSDVSGGASGELSLADFNAEIAKLMVLYKEGTAAEYQWALGVAKKLLGVSKTQLREWVETGSAGQNQAERVPAAEVPTSPGEAGDLVDGLLPNLVIYRGNFAAVAKIIRDAFRDGGDVYDRGVPVRVVAPATPGALPKIVPLTPDAITNEVHERFRVVVRRKRAQQIWLETENLPERIPKLYLALERKELPQLLGITTAPVLTEDGGIHTAEGYHRESGLYCTGIPALAVPRRPTEAEAREALFLLRRAFRTFAFDDAPRRIEKMTDRRREVIDVSVVDLGQPPGRDESAVLCGLLMAVCRPNLWLAPALMVNAPQISGSGTGKGLLLCGLSIIAFGVLPVRFSHGGNPEELEKRISAALLEARLSVVLENLNNTTVLSATLESALTDRPCYTRQFRTLELVELVSSTWLGITGNGSTPGRDLVRKVIVATLNAHTEVPTLRKFALADNDWLDHLRNQRAALLSAALTIWRFGRQREAAGKLDAGLDFGSYTQFCRWCRDPLLALGCQDPVGRIHALRAADPEREDLAELYSAWWQHHEDRWVSPATRPPSGAERLAPAVRKIVDPDKKGPQWLRSKLNRLDGNRDAGFVFERFKDPKHPTSPSTFRIMRAT
jgi:hypothetical protein